MQSSIATKRQIASALLACRKADRTFPTLYGQPKIIHYFKQIQMTQSKATRSIIDTHRNIFGPKLRQKFVENIGFDDSKPLPQANVGEMFFYRESVDVDYSMEIQRQSGVTLCVNSYGGEVETFAQHIIKASTVDTLKFLHDESFELRDRFPKDIVSMANAHA